jgi:RpiR family carbohydrate utilization transcriptional regulator
MDKNKKIIFKKEVPILQRLSRNQNSLPKIQQKIGKIILDNPSKAIKMSISSIAQEAGAKSEASVVHFYRALGFESFADFKVSLAAEISGNTFYHVYEDIKIDDDIEAIKNKIFSGSIKVLNDNMNLIDSKTLSDAVKLIEKSKRIILLGFASSAVIAMYANTLFSFLGFNCQFNLDSHVNAILTANLEKNDLIIAISYSGESKDIVVQSKQAKPLAKVIAITGFNDSSLAKVADVCITTISEEMNYRTDAMVSRMVQLAVIDTLFTSLAIRKGNAGLNNLLKARQSLSYLKF